MRQMLLQNATAVLLPNAAKFITKCLRLFITKCESFITKCDNFIAKCDSCITKCDDFITKCDSCITKCDVYYKLRQYIQHLTPLLDLICLILSKDENMITTGGLLLKLFQAIKTFKQISDLSQR